MVAKLQPEFKKRNVKTIAISVDPVDSHYGWVKDIEETQDAKVFNLSFSIPMLTLAPR